MAETITVRRLQFATVLKPPLFPVDLPELMRLLPDEGYILADEVRELHRESAVRVDAQGVLARKASLALLVDSRRGLIALLAEDSGVLVKEHRSLVDLISTKMDIDVFRMTYYHELLATATLSARRPSYDVFARQPVTPMTEISSALFEQMLTPHGIRLSSKGENPNQPNWMEINIDPLAASGGTRYFAQVVCRNSNYEIVRKTTEGLEAKLIKIIESLESD